MRGSEFQDLSTVQSEQNAMPPTVASATTVAIKHFLTFVSGTTAIATVTPPVKGAHMLILIFTDSNPGGVTTGGNINAALDPAQYRPVMLFYDPAGAKYYPAAPALS